MKEINDSVYPLWHLVLLFLLASCNGESREGKIVEGDWRLERYESEEVVCFTAQGKGLWCHWKK